MMMNGVGVEFIGSVAGLLTTVAFIPQVLQVWRSRSADGLSMPTFAIFCTGVLLWVVYGIAIGAPSIIAANLVTFSLALALVVMKVVFARRPNPPDGIVQISN